MSKTPTSLSAADLAQRIDISAVQTFHAEADIRSLAALAVENGFIAAHALPNFVPLLRSLVPAGGRTLVGGPIGFPSGGHMTAIKVAEAAALREAGADELDMMINVGRLKSGDLNYVRDEIAAVIEAAAPVPLKVILELHHLTDTEIETAADIVASSGAAFVKTGTGWTPAAATLPRIRLIAAVVAGRAGIKASGGIRDLATVAEMVALGVTRFGINTASAIELVKQVDALPGGRLAIAPANERA
ncbi:deoxyribose-phosphate aldolase [Kaistia nematophila]|uniref:Deoxyribose-phosphate aldolase n=1 Tax=Kaistia nematophila TaxID=2994654 RepID=A0A9X3IKX0_9HYPH|nr:deoxyribose-phosphate aldolase [Kaistia nematophila]MCX5569913.1 deoxyribose-phosphate aldolase [Kaistia nematophila]